MKKYITLLMLVVFAFASFAKNAPLCDKSSKKGDSCYLLFKDIRPTQANVGKYKIKVRNLPKYQEVGKKAFEKTHSVVDVEKAIEEEQAKKDFPVIKAPDGKFYLVDRHHNTTAIYDFYRINEDWLHINPLNVRILVTLEKDYSDSLTMADFWDKMERKNYFWPYEFDKLSSKYIKYDYRSLPESIKDLGNDPYRSAMGLAQKEAFEDPTGKEIYFYQFKWGMCSEQLGFIDPLRFDGSEETIRKSINFLTIHADEMARVCIGDCYEDMPKPQVI